MSRGIHCDQCGDYLIVNSRGDDEHGEISGWIEIKIVGETFSPCTISCATGFLQEPAIREATEEHMEAIAQIVQAIKEADDA